MFNRRTLLAGAAAAAVAPLASRAFAGPQSQQLDALYETFFHEGLRLAPEGATELGLDKGADADLAAKLGDVSTAGIEAQKAASKSRLARLRAFDRKALMKLAGDVEHNTDDNMRIEYSAPLNLHTDTIRKNNLLIEVNAVIPLFAMNEGDLLTLARFYAEHDIYWNRPLQAVRLARELRPDDPEVQALFDEYHADVEGRIMFEIGGSAKR